MLTFSNPRLSAHFDNWPIGSGNVGQCVFKVVAGGSKGVRVTRETTDRNGRWCKPKTDTYTDKAAIVDGSDGKTYILKYNHLSSAVTINRHDFKNAEGEYAFFPINARYNGLRDLINSAK